MKTILYKFICWNFHLILKAHFSFGKKGIILQAGANDGKTLDPINFLVKKKGNQSILLEPVPEFFAQLENNYRGFDNIILLNKAVTEEPVPVKKFYYLRPVPGIEYKTSYSMFGSFSLEHLVKMKNSIPHFDKMLTVSEVPCTTFEALIDEFAPAGVRLIHTDVEGYDVKILKTINFEKCKPKIILFEHMHVDKKELLQFLATLKGHGYRTYSYGYDTICLSQAVGNIDVILKTIGYFKPNIFKK